MFVQSQCLEWMHGPLQAVRRGAEVKILSADDDTGATTALVRFPPGWQSADKNVLNCEEELLVLNGSLHVSGQELGLYGYACLPSGYDRDNLYSKNGAVALIMFAAEPVPLCHSTDHDERRVVIKPSIYQSGLEAWTENPYSRYLMGTGVHPLREDPDTGEISILYSALPYRYMAKRWTHTYVQEMYVLAGEYSINDVGVMAPGAYAWWEPEFVHGPYGSLTGFMMFIRSVGGPLQNIIEPEIIEVDYCAPYQPVLPPELAQCAAPLNLPANY